MQLPAAAGCSIFVTQGQFRVWWPSGHSGKWWHLNSHGERQAMPLYNFLGHRRHPLRHPDVGLSEAKNETGADRSRCCQGTSPDFATHPRIHPPHLPKSFPGSLNPRDAPPRDIATGPL